MLRSPFNDSFAAKLCNLRCTTLPAVVAHKARHVLRNGAVAALVGILHPWYQRVRLMRHQESCLL